MRAELIKLRAMPTPRWTALGALGALLVMLAATGYWGIGEDDVALGLGAELPTSVAAIILGTWIVGVEYGQRTMHRTLSADPRRMRVIGVKLATALVAALALTVVVFAVAAAVLPAIASAHDQDLTVMDVMRSGLAALIGNGALVIVGVAFALFTRSMAGGVTLALVYAFVIDSAVSAIPKVGDYTAQSANWEIWEVITQQPGDSSLVPAVFVLAAWCAGLLAIGGWRFVKPDA